MQAQEHRPLEFAIEELRAKVDERDAMLRDRDTTIERLNRDLAFLRSKVQRLLRSGRRNEAKGQATYVQRVANAAERQGALQAQAELSTTVSSPLDLARGKIERVSAGLEARARRSSWSMCYLRAAPSWGRLCPHLATIMQTSSTLRFLGLGALLTTSSFPVAAAQTAPCWNYGSLARAADGVHMGNVLLGTPSLLGDPGDGSVQYPNPVSGGAADSTTRLPYQPALNPASNQPFTVEFWAEPWVDATSGAGPCPLFNRQSAGNRSGWVWFQRAPGAGWNFAMYSGVGSAIGINLTGGSATPFTLNHLVATWDGATATLYHNGIVVASGSGPYTANQAGVTLSVGGYDTGENGYQGVVDDLAIYGVALNASEVAALYALGASTQRNLHGMTVINGGALLYWRNLAEESIGARYCNPSVSNSLGTSAALDANGSRAVAANDVTLVATLMPANIFGFFLGGQTQAMIGQPGGSQGVLCLGGVIGRYVGPNQIQNSGAGGSFELNLDLTQTPAGPVFVAINAGETWNFQAWYRDSTGGLPSSNFTDAVAITFE